MDDSKKLRHRPIGQMLMESNAIIPQDLEFALDHQQFSNELLGQILLRMGAVTDNDLNAVLDAQSGRGRVAA
jgi:hypothetical protein